MKTAMGRIPSESVGRPLITLFNANVWSPYRRDFMAHRHAEAELSAIISGSGTYATAAKRYRMSPGDVFLFRSNEAHCITEVSGEGGLKLLILQFEPRLFDSPENAALDHAYPGALPCGGSVFENRLACDAPGTGAILAHLGDIERELKEKDTDYELMAKTKLLELLVTLHRRYGYFCGEPAEAKSRCLCRLGRAATYIDAHITDDLDLAGIARAAAMSRTYFCTAFKRCYGMTPWEYVVSGRVNLAKRMLAETDRTVLEVATECGFNSLSNFSHAFKKYIGTAPSEIRRGSEDAAQRAPSR